MERRDRWATFSTKTLFIRFTSCGMEIPFLENGFGLLDVSYQLRTVHLWGDFWRQSSSIHFLSSCSSLTNPFLSLPPNHHHSPPNPPLRRLRTIWPNAHRPRPPQIRQRQQMHLPRNSLHLLFLGSRLVRPHE